MLAALPAAAAAEQRADGSLARGQAGPRQVVANLQNTSTAGERLDFLRLELNGVQSAENPVLSGVPGSCGANGSVIVCAVPGGWAPGQRLNVTYDTTPVTPANAGARLFVCGGNCNSAADDRGPFTVPGPSDGRVDLVVSKNFAFENTGPVGEGPLGPAPGQYFRAFASVSNHGDVEATNVVFREELPPGLDLFIGETSPAAAEYEARSDENPVYTRDLFENFCTITRFGDPPRTVIECRFPLGAERSFAIFLDVVSPQTGRRTNVATATSDQMDANPDDNRAESFPVTVTNVGDTEITGGDPNGLNGTAEGSNPEGEVPSFNPDGDRTGRTDQVLRAHPASGRVFAAQEDPEIRRLSRLAGVEVAIRRIRGRPRCFWLRNRRGRFSRDRPQGGRCGRGRWLRARGTRRWRLRLRRALPPGRYVAYSRAVNRAGAREREFSRADGNLITFRITRRRR